MRKHILPSLLVLAFGLAIAGAQTISRGLQLSQDPTGAFGVDTNNNVYFPAHVLSTGTPPTVASGCGSAPVITGTDTAGLITMGTGAPTGCAITFNKAYVSVPSCVVAWQSNITSMQWTAATNGLNITQTATSSNKVNYWCSSIS